MTHLIIGCGYLGRRVAELWQSENKVVAALTRGRTDDLRRNGLVPIRGDVLEPTTLQSLPAVDTVLYAVGMDRSAGRSFREVYVDGLRNVLDALPTPKRFIYISSTSVYGQTGGEEVDENSPTEPLENNGQVLLEAEQLLRSRLPDAIVLRFAGIYGPGRILRRAAIEKGDVMMGDSEKWLNLIHVHDGAAAVLAAEQHSKPGRTFLVSDGHPVRRRNFYGYLAELLKAPAPRFQPIPPGTPPPPHEAGNRKIRNRRMLEELKVELSYEDCYVGLPASLS